jgi:hypothetical protein
MTTCSVFVGATAVYIAIHNSSRQLNTQIYLAYSDRLQSIRRSMRADLMSTRIADPDLSDDSQIPPGALETLHIIYELFELRVQGYVRTSIWNVWCRDIDRFLNAPKIRQGREQIRQEFQGHLRFIAWVEQRQDGLAAEPNAAPRSA